MTRQVAPLNCASGGEVCYRRLPCCLTRSRTTTCDTRTRLVWRRLESGRNRRDSSRSSAVSGRDSSAEARPVSLPFPSRRRTLSTAAAAAVILVCDDRKRTCATNCHNYCLMLWTSIRRELIHVQRCDCIGLSYYTQLYLCRQVLF